MTSFLPQHDPNPARRQRELDKGQKTYTYNYTHVSPLAIVDRVPIHDEFSFRWLETVAERVLVGLANRADLEADPHHRDHHLSRHKLLTKLLSVGETVLSDVKHMVTEALRMEMRIGARPERPESMEDYVDLFRTIGLPPVTRGCRDNHLFAWMRVAGPNPLMLRQMSSSDERFPVTDADLHSVIPGDTLDAAMAEGRLFLTDYAALNVPDGNDYPNGPKYLYAPLAMFAVSPATKELLPVAIQCRQDPGPDNPVLTPADGHNWLIAKTVVEMADGNYHEAFSHLGRTHLFMEPFVVSTLRQLAGKHPVHVLLRPHFEGTLAINQAAWQHLVSYKGAVEKLFSAPIGAARSLAVEGVKSARVEELLLPRAIADRGVGDAQIPVYPYRDDAMLYWNAIRQWVSDYVDLYYHSDQDVVDDIELQQWGSELSSTEGGRLTGLPANGHFTTSQQLKDVLTLVIYTCSVQHAAVNFPQCDIMSYAPNMPLGLYAKAPSSKTGATEEDHLKMLPPMDMAELQMELGYLLGTVHYTQLGQYEATYFRDPQVSEPLNRFHHVLSSIHGRIEERNLHRLCPYNTLLPEGIPQSINI